jgi:acetylornithine/succinyldiaminopimelate/putrescine aminotransferase
LAAIAAQSADLLFQSNAVALAVRARAAERLVAVAPAGLERVFLVNSGAEANENALRMAFVATGRKRVLALERGFHGRTAAAGAVTWNSGKWYGFPQYPMDVGFSPPTNIPAAAAMIDESVAAVIFEPVQGVAGGFDLSGDFIRELRRATQRSGALLIADEVQSGMGRSGQFFAVQHHGVEPDLLTVAKGLGGGIPCGAVLASRSIAGHFGLGDLGTTFGGGPVAAAASAAVIDAIQREGLLANVRDRELQIRAECLTGPVTGIRGLGLLLGLVCDRPAADVRNYLLEHDILTGTSSDPRALRILAPLTLEAHHVTRLAGALASLAPL